MLSRRPPSPTSQTSTSASASSRRKDPRRGEHLEAGRLQLFGERLCGLTDGVDQRPELGLGDRRAVANDALGVRTAGAGW